MREKIALEGHCSSAIAQKSAGQWGAVAGKAPRKFVAIYALLGTTLCVSIRISVAPFSDVQVIRRKLTHTVKLCLLSLLRTVKVEARMSAPKGETFQTVVL